MFNYILYKIGILLVFFPPLKVAYRIATFISDVYFLASKKDRRIVMNNLKAILEDSLTNKSDKEIFLMARNVFRNFAKYLVDFFRSSKMKDSFIDKNIHIKNVRYLDEALKKGRGIIALSAHLGNWELGAILISKLGYPLNAVVLDHKNKKVNDLFVGQRRGSAIKVISTGAMLRKCFQALKKNELLALLGDRDFSNHGMELTFLGKKTTIPKGPAALSIKTGAAIVPVFLLRNPDDSFDLVFDEEIAHQVTGDFDSDLEILTKKVIGLLEDYIKRYPEQWCMFGKFWN